MKTPLLYTYLLLGLFLFGNVIAYGQSNHIYYTTQYFDGADTAYNDGTNYKPAVKVSIDSTVENVWQIGIPQKAIFNSAASVPNVLVTDTANPYPVNNTSSFRFNVYSFGFQGIKAIQWEQKLDFDMDQDGGKIEYSLDNGQTWENVFDNPNTYNFYGFDTLNTTILPNGDAAFSGTDTTWRDVWLCFDNSWLYMQDPILLKFTMVSDSIDSQKEGWMIDNLIVHNTELHTGIKGGRAKSTYFNVYPNPAKDRVMIEVKEVQDFHIIESLVLVNMQGKILKEWKNVPTHYFIDTKNYPEGVYILKIKTNKHEGQLPIIIKRN